MPKVLITDGMDKTSIADLKNSGFEVTEQFYPEPELIQEIAKYDAVVVRSATKITEPVIDGGKNLKLIIRGGVGVDNIKVKYAESKGICVKNTPAASSDSVAELALGLMFAAVRQIPQASASMKAGQWEKKAFSKGTEIGGKVLGIIGMGRIGARLAQKAASLGMKVMLGYDKFPEQVQFHGVPLKSKEEVIAEADFISLHIPADPEGPVIGAKEFALMKAGVVIVNCARGGVVDEDALLAALNSGKVRAAAIDVWVGEPNARRDLVEHPNVIPLPHIGAATVEGQARVGGEVVGILKDFFKK
jgi:D-3-phosphoglycerate dehydrogenase / 2-oxoglutarate reductase